MGLIFENNQTFQEGGGLTSVLLPKRLTKFGVGLGIGVGTAASMGTEMFKMHNQMKVGKVTYQGGPQRMTDNFNSGAIEAIANVTDDPKIQQEMISKVLKNSDSLYGNIEEFGVDGAFLSAFYGMR